MITRAQIRRQLRKNGGIMNTVPRTGFFLGGIKDRIRKLIPNEIANVASKAAPFVAMLPGYGPAAAGLMRGIGRFDKRGSVSDALKQGIGTYAGGKLFGAGMERFAGRPTGGSALETLRELPGKTLDLIKPGEPGSNIITKGTKNLLKQQLLFGAATGGLSYIYEKFMKEEPEQQEGETMGEYMARRKRNVSAKMRQYMDNYMAFDKDYSSKTDEEKTAYIDSLNTEYEGYYQGGRVGLANGSPHFDPPTFSEGVPQMFMSDELGALPKAEGGVRSEDMGILSVDDFDNVENYRRYRQALALEMEKKEKPEGGGGTKKTGIKGLLEKIGENIRYKFDDFVYGAPYSISSNYPPEIFKDPKNRAIIRKKYDTLSPEKQEYIEMFLDSIAYPDDEQYSEWLYKKPGKIKFPVNEKQRKHNEQFAQGGRIKKYGGGVTAAMPKIPTGTPRVNAGGISELDYRAKGGFVPVGVKEKADDVPAMLSKNEFVMTADAVKGAGGGNVEKGAQKMYNTMKRLEGRVA